MGASPQIDPSLGAFCLLPSPHLSTLRGTGSNPTQGKPADFAWHAVTRSPPRYSWGKARSPSLLVGLDGESQDLHPTLPGTGHPVPLILVGSNRASQRTRLYSSWHERRKPERVSSLDRGNDESERRRITPQPHLRALTRDCRLVTAQISCSPRIHIMEKPQSALALEDISSIAERLAISRSAIYAWVKDGRFPAPTKLGRNSRWITSEVNAWVEERRPATDAPVTRQVGKEKESLLLDDTIPVTVP